MEGVKSVVEVSLYMYFEIFINEFVIIVRKDRIFGRFVFRV